MRRVSTARILAALLVLGTPVFAAAPHAGAASADAALEDPAARLQTRVFGLADRLVQGYAELLTELASHPELAPARRLAAHLEKVHTASAVYSLAASPSPESALIDLMALSMIRRLQLVGGGAEQRFGASRDAVARLVAFTERVESEIWAAGAEYLSPAELEEFRRLAEEWHRDNAQLEFSSLVHLHTFVERRAKGRLGQVAGGARGLLGPLRDTAAKMDAARLASERAMYLSVRLPLLARWQVEALGYRFLELPESKRLLESAESLAKSCESLAGEAARLPSMLAGEREAWLQGAEALSGKADALLRETRAGLEDASRILERAEKLGQLGRDTGADLRASLVIAENLQRQYAASAFAQATPQQALRALGETRATAEALRASLEAAERLLSPAPDAPLARTQALLAESEACGRRLIDHAAWRAAQVAVGGLALWAVLLLLLRRRN